MFEQVKAAPPDAILGISEAFRADTNTAKINLSVGVYQNESGATPKLVAVQTAEQQMAAEGTGCLLYTSPSPRDATLSRMPSSA